MITVACVLVRGNVDYSMDYVSRLRSMVARHLPTPHAFACLTDQPSDVPPGVRPVQVAPSPGLAGWWAKMELFNPAHQLGERVLYLDLDTLVVADLLEVATWPGEFALVPDAGTFQGRNGLKVVKRFNSSVMNFRPEAVRGLYEAWSPQVGLRLWGDQDFIGEQMPGADTMPLSWFPRLSAARPPWDADVKVVLCKKPKNHEAAERWPWFRDSWG